MSEYKYNAVVDLNNFNNSHTLAYLFVERLGMANLRVLEVGCSAGYFGAMLKAAGHHVTGVEPDEKSASKAATLLDEVFCGFVEDFFKINPDRQFDVITFGDVLEHITNPESVLVLAKKYLKPDGRVIISVPNVGHACVRAMLRQGDWTYSELGILDRTHVRFFTKKELVNLLRTTGFKIESLQSVQLTLQAAADLCKLSINTQVDKEKLAEDWDDTLEDFQYVISAANGENSAEQLDLLSRPHVMKIIILADEPRSTLTRIRLIEPLHRLVSAKGYQLRIKKFASFCDDDLCWADVFVVQRGSTRKALEVAHDIKSAGKPFIYEIDDLLTDIPDFLPHHGGYVKNREKIFECMNLASAVTVTTPKLGRTLNLATSKYFVCPNYARALNDAPFAVSEAHGDVVTLVLASSDKVLIDFVLEPIRSLQAKFGEKLKLIVVGPIGERIRSAGIFAEFHDLLSYDDFNKFMRGLSNPIGVIPLDDSIFSSCKSPVKYFDYTTAGMPVICSNVSPYMDVICSGVDGMLVENTTEDWVNRLTDLIESRELRQSLVSGATKTVRNSHRIEDTICRWDELLQKLVPEEQRASKRGFKVKTSLGQLVRLRVSKLIRPLRDLNRLRREKRRAKAQAKLGR